MKKELVREVCSVIEKEISIKLSLVRILPASFDKRFCSDIQDKCHSPEGITERQREFLYKLFRKYRRQIPKYEEMLLFIDPKYRNF